MSQKLTLLSLALFAVAPLHGEMERREKPLHVIVEPSRNLSTADRSDLEALGLTIVKPLPGGKYLGRVTTGTKPQRDPRIVSIEPLRAEHKLHHSAKREAAHVKAFADFQVFFHDDVSFDDARAAILAVGGSIDPLKTDFGYTRTLSVRLRGDRLQQLAGDERVKTVTQGHRRKPKSQNVNAASLSGVTPLYATPYSLSGQNVRVSLFEVLDGIGAQTTHRDFGGRVTNDVVFNTGSSLDWHATHVAGTIGGSGAGNGFAKGMAPGARLQIFQVHQDYNQILALKKSSARDFDITVDNNSWSYGIWEYDGGYWKWYEEAEDDLGTYNLFVTAPLDEIAVEENILYVHSSANYGKQPDLPTYGVHRHAGTGAENWCFWRRDCPAPCSLMRCVCYGHPGSQPWTTIGAMESAKNILTVGATMGHGIIWDYSSRGPTRDGRIKPELVARGVGLHSTVPTDSYSVATGTSMSSAVVTGIAALLTEQWQKTFGADPLMAALKTVMIAGAQDVGNAGPDYSYGFGIANAQVSADLIIADGATGNRIRIGSLSTGERYETDVTLSATHHLRVHLGWADPPIEYLGGSDVAESALVNDLDVAIIGPTGTVTYPYILDKNSPWLAATRGSNRVDNTEMVEITNAPAGRYRVVVNGSNVRQGPQQFVLVANAPVSSPDSAVLVLTATGSGTSVALSWNGIGTGSSYDIYRRSAPGAYSLLASNVSSTTYTDSSVAPDNAYLYGVVAKLSGGVTVSSNADVATTMADPTVAAGSIIRHSHLQSMIAAANSLRALAGLGGILFSSSPAVGGHVYAAHLTELRAGIAGARNTLGLASIAYSRTITPGLTVFASDFSETRAALPQ